MDHSQGTMMAFAKVANAMANPLNAPIRASIWNARAVPMPWATVPRTNPANVGSFTPLSLSNGGPIIAPKIPVVTTNAAVNEGIPPKDSAIAIATGLVVDFGASETKVTSSRPNKPPKTSALPAATTTPTHKAQERSNQ